MSAWLSECHFETTAAAAPADDASLPSADRLFSAPGGATARPPSPRGHVALLPAAAAARRARLRGGVAHHPVAAAQVAGGGGGGHSAGVGGAAAPPRVPLPVQAVRQGARRHHRTQPVQGPHLLSVGGRRADARRVAARQAGRQSVRQSVRLRPAAAPRGRRAAGAGRPTVTPASEGLAQFQRCSVRPATGELCLTDIFETVGPDFRLF